MPDETITTTKPAPFIEAAGTTLTERLMPLLNPANAMDTASYAPTVAAQDPLQQQAYQQAAGLGSFEPFLAQAGAEATGAQQFVGPQAYQEFMSPYQQEVIDTSLAAMDREQQKGIGALRQRAAQAGAFGGGREAAALGEYQATADIARAAQEAQLRQAGFQDARAAASADLAARQGLGQFQTAIGAGQRQLDQAKLAADQEAAREAAFADYTRLGLVGPQLASVIGGFPAATQVQSTPPPSATQQLLGLGIGGAGLAGALGFKPFG